MASPGGIGGNGNGLLLYGVIIRDKIQTADLDMLRAYHIVANDLLDSGGHGDDGELRASIEDLERAIQSKT